jgi:hypothetical protein
MEDWRTKPRKTFWMWLEEQDEKKREDDIGVLAKLLIWRMMNERDGQQFNLVSACMFMREHWDEPDEDISLLHQAYHEYKAPDRERRRLYAQRKRAQRRANSLAAMM